MKQHQYEYTDEAPNTTVDSLLQELVEILKAENTINNTWSRVYSILKREGRM